MFYSIAAKDNDLRLKPNADEFRAALARHNRREVYHWTPAARLPSILEHGILCRRELDRRGIEYEPHGYGASGKELDFGGHFCVSFYPQKGMMKSEVGSLAIIEMSSELVLAEGAFYCPQNTAKSEYTFEELCTRTAVEHFDDLFVGPTEWHLLDWQAEVWIPDGIPASQIRRVLFRTADERDAAVQACRTVASRLPGEIRFELGQSWQFPTPSQPDA